MKRILELSFVVKIFFGGRSFLLNNLNAAVISGVVKSHRLRWAGHVARAPPTKVLDGRPTSPRPQRMPLSKHLFLSVSFLVTIM